MVKVNPCTKEAMESRSLKLEANLVYSAKVDKATQRYPVSKSTASHSARSLQIFHQYSYIKASHDLTSCNDSIFLAVSLLVLRQGLTV